MNVISQEKNKSFWRLFDCSRGIDDGVAAGLGGNNAWLNAGGGMVGQLRGDWIVRSLEHLL